MVSQQAMAQRDCWQVWLSIMVIVAMGLLMLASSSLAIADYTFGTPFHYFIRQCIYLMLGTILAVICYYIPLQWWYRYRTLLLLVAFVSLLMVYIPGLGVTINGARRWLRFGVINLEVCEAVKFAFVIYLAGYVADRRDRICEAWGGFLVPAVILFVFMAFLLMQPDFGTVLVLVSILFFMLFMAGFPTKRLILMIAIAFVGLFLIAILEPYRVMRLVSFLNPWEDPYNHGYQLTQSLMAIGRGGILGQGLGNGIQKLFYLPEAHTDFIYAILCEELGLIGGLVVIAAFTTLFVGLMRMGRFFEKQQSDFAAYVAYGTSAWLAMQSIVNIGVSTGCLPTKGLTLPLMSYGGSHVLVTMAMLGIIMRLTTHRIFKGEGLR